MKKDTTTTLLNFVLAVLVISGVVFAYFAMMHTRDLRQMQPRAQMLQVNMVRVQALANDAAVFNATAKNPELAQILQSVQPPQPAAK